MEGITKFIAKLRNKDQLLNLAFTDYMLKEYGVWSVIEPPTGELNQEEREALAEAERKLMALLDDGASAHKLPLDQVIFYRQQKDGMLECMGIDDGFEESYNSTIARIKELGSQPYEG